MKRMCGWCGQELDQTERRHGQALTHGLCPACRSRFFPVGKKDEEEPSTENEEEDDEEGTNTRPLTEFRKLLKRR